MGGPTSFRAAAPLPTLLLPPSFVLAKRLSSLKIRLGCRLSKAFPDFRPLSPSLLHEAGASPSSVHILPHLRPPACSLRKRRNQGLFSVSEPCAWCGTVCVRRKQRWKGWQVAQFDHGPTAARGAGAKAWRPQVPGGVVQPHFSGLLCTSLPWQGERPRVHLAHLVGPQALLKKAWAHVLF